METLTHTLYLKHTFTDKELADISQKMARAEFAIREKQDELKSVSSSIKAEIDEQSGVLHGCAEKLRSGYEMRRKECNVTYEGKIVKYIDQDTGEVLDEHEMSEDEQLQLTGVRVDAEKIIRDARAEEN